MASSYFSDTVEINEKNIKINDGKNMKNNYLIYSNETEKVLISDERNIVINEVDNEKSINEDNKNNEKYNKDIPNMIFSNNLDMLHNGLNRRKYYTIDLDGEASSIGDEIKINLNAEKKLRQNKTENFISERINLNPIQSLNLNLNHED